MTKAKILKKQKALLKKQWKILSQEIRRDGCAICGRKEFTDTHHLLSKEAKEYKQWYLEPMNLIPLCKFHHKWDRKLSPHKNAIGFSEWLKNNRSSQYEWVVKNL